MLQENPQPCQRRGESDGEPVGKSRGATTQAWPPPLCLTTVASICLQTLKEYQRKLDTSGLKPSNDLYTEYKVALLPGLCVSGSSRCLKLNFAFSLNCRTLT